MEQRDIGWHDRQLICRAMRFRGTTERAMTAIEIPALHTPWTKIRDGLVARGLSRGSSSRDERLVWSTLSRLSGRRGIVHSCRAIPVDAELLGLLLAFCQAVVRFERPRWDLEPTHCPVCRLSRPVPRVLKLEWMRRHMEEHRQRVAGVLIGLAAGDENGGPTEMALRLAESLLECSRYDPDDVFARYLAWHREGSYDTGPVTGRVLTHALAGMPHAQAAEQTDLELDGMTAGCNAAHRAGVPAMAPWLNVDGLVQAARDEARLTHRHPIAADTAIAVAVKCRDNMMGNSRFASRHLRAVSEQLHAEVREAINAPRPVLGQLLDPSSPARKQLHRGGYSPGTLRAALAFATTGRDPITALQAAKSFAGPDNYCPVLVGAFLGARFGADVFDDVQLQHHPAEHIARIRKAAWGLAELWRPDAEQTHAG